jgi:hypothetical protein
MLLVEVAGVEPASEEPFGHLHTTISLQLPEFLDYTSMKNKELRVRQLLVALLFIRRGASHQQSVHDRGRSDHADSLPQTQGWMQPDMRHEPSEPRSHEPYRW